MRIQIGHGKKTLGLNIAEFIRCDGITEAEASRLAKKIARKHFIKKYPDKEIPEYLEGNDD